MKKFTLLLLIAALLLMTACGAEEAAADEPSQYIGTWVSVAYETDEGMSAIERGFEDALVLEIHEDGTYVFDPTDPIEGVWVDEGDKITFDKGTDDEESYPFEDGIMHADWEDNGIYFAKEGSEVSEREQKLFDEADAIVKKDGSIETK